MSYLSCWSVDAWTQKGVVVVREESLLVALATYVFASGFGAFGALFFALTSPSKHFHYDIGVRVLAGSEVSEGVVED